MSWKWIFVAFCLIVIIGLCEAGDKGKSKKKSKAQMEKEAKKAAKGTTATTGAVEPSKPANIDGKNRRKTGRIGKREVPASALLQKLGPYPETS